MARAKSRVDGWLQEGARSRRRRGRLRQRHKDGECRWRQQGRGHGGGDRETFLSLADVNQAIVQRFALCWWSCSVSALRTLTTHAGATERSVHTKLT
jgi:hypothetical protein